MCVCVLGGGGGDTDTFIYAPSVTVKNQYKQDHEDVIGYNGYLRNSRLCQFIEIVHKIINWYITNNCLLVLYKHIIQLWC